MLCTSLHYKGSPPGNLLLLHFLGHFSTVVSSKSNHLFGYKDCQSLRDLPAWLPTGKNALGMGRVSLLGKMTREVQHYFKARPVNKVSSVQYMFQNGKIGLVKHTVSFF